MRNAVSFVRWVDGEPEIDAAVAAGAMKLGVEYFLRQVRRGDIRTRVERGVGEDEGNYRLSFRSYDRDLKLTIGNDGQIVGQELTLHTRKFLRKKTRI